MALALTLAGTVFATPIVTAPPVIASEVMFAYFGGSQAKSGNRTATGPAFTDVGTGPVYQSNYAAFTPFTAALSTGVRKNSAGKTFMIVCKTTGTFVANYKRIFTADDGTGVTFRYFTTGPRLELAGTTTNNTTATLVVPATSWGFYAGAIGDAGDIKIYDKTSGTASTNGGTGGNLSVALPNGLMELNSGAASETFVEGIDVAWAGIWNANLGSSDINDVYLAVQSSLALRDIII